MANIMLHLNAWKRRAKTSVKEKKNVRISDNTHIVTVDSKNLYRDDVSGNTINPRHTNTQNPDEAENYPKQQRQHSRRVQKHKSSQHHTTNTTGRSVNANTMNALVVRKQSEAAHSDGESRPASPTTSKRSAGLSAKTATSRGRGSEDDSGDRKPSSGSLPDPEFGEFDAELEGDEDKSERLRRYWKRITRIVSSQLGLLVILLIYAFIGAAIFQAIEGPHEKDQREDLKRIRDILLREAWLKAQNGTSYEDFTNSIENTLQQYDEASEKAFEHGIIAGDDARIWDYWGSLFFSTTIFTTVGYGHIAPATSEGRVATMLYATVGIPLFFVVMANLGRLLTRFIKYLWSYVRRLYYTQTCRRIRKSIAKFFRERFKKKDKTRDTRKPSEEVTDTDSYVDYEVDDHFNLHPVVAVTITVLYIFFGALVYVQWEPWTYLEAFYFIFVSVSTIGFGDLVPKHPKYFLASSIYILLGLSLVAMVINVIMEFFSNTLTKAKEKVENISRSIGLDMDKLDSVSSRRKHTSPPCESKGKLKQDITTKDITDSPAELGKINRAFNQSDNIFNNDICKDSGYAENTGSTFSSESESAESDEETVPVPKGSIYKTSVIMNMDPTKKMSSVNGEETVARGHLRTQEVVMQYHSPNRTNSYGDNRATKDEDEQ